MVRGNACGGRAAVLGRPGGADVRDVGFGDGRGVLRRDVHVFFGADGAVDAVVERRPGNVAEGLNRARGGGDGRSDVKVRKRGVVDVDQRGIHAFFGEVGVHLGRRCLETAEERERSDGGHCEGRCEATGAGFGFHRCRVSPAQEQGINDPRNLRRVIDLRS